MHLSSHRRLPRANGDSEALRFIEMSAAREVEKAGRSGRDSGATASLFCRVCTLKANWPHHPLMPLFSIPHHMPLIGTQLRPITDTRHLSP